MVADKPSIAIIGCNLTNMELVNRAKNALKKAGKTQKAMEVIKYGLKIDDRELLLRFMSKYVELD